MGTGPGEHQMAAKQLQDPLVATVEVSQIQYFEKSTKPEFFNVPPCDVLDLSAEMESSN